MIGKGLIAVSAVLALSLMTSGCAREMELWNQPHTAEGEAFGDTNRHIMAQQIVDPDPVRPTAEEAAVDGRPTQKAITTYKNKEVSISGSGGGAGAGGGGSATSAKVAVSAK